MFWHVAVSPEKKIKKTRSLPHFLHMNQMKRMDDMSAFVVPVTLENLQDPCSFHVSGSKQRCSPLTTWPMVGCLKEICCGKFGGVLLGERRRCTGI